jgi:hypothetical protein
MWALNGQVKAILAFILSFLGDRLPFSHRLSIVFVCMRGTVLIFGELQVKNVIRSERLPDIRQTVKRPLTALSGHE